jgi:hypothetical protein
LHERDDYCTTRKNTSELLDKATLVVCYQIGNSFVDSGPNNIKNGSGTNVQFDTNGRVNESLRIGSNYSFFLKNQISIFLVN